MPHFNKYLYIFKSTWQEFMAYRANFFLEIFGMMALFGAIIFLWISAYRNSVTGIIGGYSLPEMLTYVIGGALISTCVMSTVQGDEIDQEINEGFVSNYLLKPLNVSLYWLTRDISRKVLIFCFGVIAFSVLIFLARGFLVSPFSSLNLVVSAVFLGLGMFLHFEIFYIAGITSFWLGRTWGFRFTIRVLMEFATGAVIPLGFVPGIWGGALMFLPFKFLAYSPMQIYLGKFSTEEIINEFAQLFIWVLFLAMIAWNLWKRGVKSYTASGS